MTSGQKDAAKASKPADDDWQQVQRKKKKKGKKKATPKAKAPDPKPKVKAHRRPRHDVVVVKAKDPKSYSEILKLLRSEPSLQDSVGSVNKVRRSTNGDMLLQLTRTCVDPGELGQRLNDAIGELGAATTRSPVTAIEIKDLDEVTSKEEICEALRTHLDAAKLGPDAVRSLRKAFAGTQTAVVTLPVQLAAKAIKLGRVRIGTGLSHHRNTWISDADNQAAIWVRKGVPVQRCSSGQSHFYTWAQIAGIYIFSIYAPPRLSQEEFIGLLNNIVDEARGKTPILVAGDFNAWATEWGSRETKPRGRALLNALATLDVLLLNTGSKPTFVGEQESL
ncbi:unnamed protein product [Trichogramma brassicae]|uniref:Endonuclease/exonuclease/phosphatase domain-containing protein n=1 Tax=Trichogramma brassicae TaxID=86971 RepID=A0A6H5IGU7_9HYME|nr:unnamed protein product [Trichogramma brassicae]